MEDFLTCRMAPEVMEQVHGYDFKSVSGFQLFTILLSLGSLGHGLCLTIMFDNHLGLIFGLLV